MVFILVWGVFGVIIGKCCFLLWKKFGVCGGGRCY